MLDYNKIGRKISFYRKKQNITQAVLAEAIDVSNGYISQLENGKAKVSLQRLYIIANYLNVDIALLLSDNICVSDSPTCSEITEIIKNWSLEEKNALAKLLICYNEHKKLK